MDHELIQNQDNVDDLISDIHHLIDDEAPAPEQEPAPAPEAPAEVQEAPAVPDAPAAEKPHHWTDRQRVPKHVAKLQNNQQEAYARWLQEQEEKGEVAPPVFEEEAPEDSDFTAKPKKKRRFFPWFCTILAVLTLAVAVVTAVFVPLRPLADNALLHTEGTSCILLAGTDESLGRTDMLMLMTVNTAKGSLSLVSLPRDTAIMTQEGIISLGSVYGRAGGGDEGIEALKDAVKDCVGFMPDGCLVLYPEAVTEFSDILGGDLTGEEALELVSALGEEETLDLTRVQTQRQYLADVISRCKAPSNFLKAPKLLDALQKNCRTDLETANFLWLARAALLIDSANAHLATLPGTAEERYYFPDEELVVQSVNAYANPYVRAVGKADLQLAAVVEE